MSEETKNNEPIETKTITLDDVQRFLNENEEGKKFLQSERGKAVAKGVETWKENNLNELIEEKIKEKFPEETEEQKRLRKLEQELQAERNERQKERLKNKALNELTQSGLPTQLADLVIGNDEESTLTRLETIKGLWDNGMKQQVESKFKENGRQPAESPNKVEKLTKEQIAKMSPEKINELFDKDPGLFEKI
jgi:hypothetical protein